MVFMLLPLLIVLPLIILAGGKTAGLKEVLQYALTVVVFCLPLIKFFL